MNLEHGCTLEDFELLVKWLVCRAPNLKHFDTIWVQEISEKWSEEQTGAIKFVELLL